MGDGHHFILEHPECDETGLTIRETIIFQGDCEAGKDLDRVPKINAMFFQIRAALILIPLELHN